VKVDWERLRVFRRVALYALFGIAAYVTALAICFPYGRVKDMAIAMAAQAGYDAEIDSAGAAFPFGVAFTDIRVRSRTPGANGKPMQFHLDSARAPFLPVILSGGNAVDVVVNGFGGRIALGAESRKGGPMHYRVRVDDVNLAQVPGPRESWNLPLTGTLHLVASLDAKTDRFADSTGEIEFNCATCTVGDGKAAVKFGGSNPFLAAGLTLPRVRLGDFAGRIAIEKGVARAEGVAIKSGDAEVTLEGEVLLRDPFAHSAVNAYLRFKLGDAMLRSASAIASVLQVAGAPGLRPDGFYGLRFAGPISGLQVTLSPSSPVGPGPGPGRMGARSAVVPSATTGSSAPAPATPPPVPVAPPPPAAPPPAPEAPVSVPPPPPPPPPTPPPTPPPPPVAAATPEEDQPAPSPPPDSPPPPDTEAVLVPPIRGSPPEGARIRPRGSGPGPGLPGGAPGGVPPGSGPTPTPTPPAQSSGDLEPPPAPPE
jgi:type II secretion system protein N